MARPEILVLGGTAEARQIAGRLAASGLFGVTLSLAGRTLSPPEEAFAVRRGGFGGIDGLAAHLTARAVALIVDATHPFAAQISGNTAAASERAGVARIALLRPPWQARAGERWHEVAGEAAAAAALPPGARALLALGSQHLAAFAGRPDVFFIVRTVDPPPSPLLAGPHAAIVGRGPFTLAGEIALLRAHRIDHVVARNSGGEGGRAKIDAAGALGLTVVMIDRPAPPRPPILESADEVVAWVMTRLAAGHGAA